MSDPRDQIVPCVLAPCNEVGIVEGMDHTECAEREHARSGREKVAWLKTMSRYGF